MITSRDRRAFALILLVACLLGGNAVIWVARSDGSMRGDNPHLVAAAPASTTTVPAPTTTPPPPTTVALPVPKAPHASGSVRDNAPVVQLGTIEIPKIGLVHPIFEGNTLTQIDHGPSHWPGTAMPGQVGNAVFAGHRVTHSHPFRNIDQLVNGDQVIFTIGGVRTTYVVTGHDVVTPKDVWIVNQTATPTATLFACHPPHSARYRYVIHLALA